ncbi:pyrroloquinoline quinone biosynthesis protein PqqB [Marinobacterium arenosum]|uniref:pyrroloquinoline quinone biosynthesis protein PqqB n=1 Tax=Marinobacterium arenosum TaxID=2862496 RepID=UPI001C983E02|nr:pyrroloquinoline quinone biosynthesis protein PqqB [Marinobacterium arenosum]MBY4677617.1 pyrroloquinoline quinone biosynthesis protein PqqB [Marinobacterium arenosum]
MKIQVLGSAAGGGFPQWNCNCANCRGVREGTLNAQPRTQSSIAISANGEDWILFNASPDIRAQLESFAPMQPGRAIRDTGIAAIVLMDSQIDHCTGLLMLREGCPHQVWCTEMVHQDLSSGFPVFNMLEHWNGGLQWNRIPIEPGANRFSIPQAPELSLTAVPLRSSAPPYSPHRNDPHPGDNIGLLVADRRSGKTLFYAPGLGRIEPHLRPLMESADLLLVDGTIWREDELIHSGVGDKLGTAMGHLPQSGEGGMIEYLDTLAKPRKVLIHINNTNPILDEDSAERAELHAHGIEVAYDGMSIEL